jgi:putative phosphoesterase
VRIGLLSDTHGLLDSAVLEYFAECDEIWHAGDFGSIDVLNELRAFKRVRGVSGNVDGAEIRVEVPEELSWECDGVRVYMRHIGGYPGNYDRAAKRQIEKLRPDLFVCGHSHILRVMRDTDLKLLHMNPGACGHNGWHKMRTMLRFSIEQGKISGVEAIELGARGRKKNG